MRRLYSVGAGAAALFLCTLTVPANDPKQLSSPDLPGPRWEGISRAPAPELPAGRRAGTALPAAAEKSPGRFELLGHEPLMSRGMNAALAVHKGYAYIGSRTDGAHPNAGVMVVDVKDPARPRVVHQIGRPNAANIGESSRELRIWPEENLLIVLNHGCSELIHVCVNATQLGENIVTSTYRFYDIAGANAAAPKLVGTYTPSRSDPQTPHEFFLWKDPKRPGRALFFQTTPSTDAGGVDNLLVTDVSQARQNKFSEIATWTANIDNPDRDNRLHSLTVSYDGTRGYLAYLGGGFLVADFSDFADAKSNPQVRLITPIERRTFWTNPGAHSAIKIPGKPYVLTTDEVYGQLGGLLADHGCPWGWPRVIDVADESTPRIVAEYRLPSNEEAACADVDPIRNNFSSFSSHNPTLLPDLAFVTWHSAGLQAIDLSDPVHPKSAAQWIPEPLPFVITEDPALSAGEDKVVVWSFPIVVDGLVYVVDLRNGLYILRYHGPHEDDVARTAFLDGNSNSGDLARFEAPPVAAVPAVVKKAKKKKAARKRSSAKRTCRRSRRPSSRGRGKRAVAAKRKSARRCTAKRKRKAKPKRKR